ncbi:transposase-like protein [Bradyrhizobium sp. USDA 3397]
MIRCMRNALAHAGKNRRPVASHFIVTAFAQDDAVAASAQWRRVANQLRPKLPKFATFLGEVETDVLACMTFSPQHELSCTRRMSWTIVFFDRDED